MIQTKNQQESIFMERVAVTPEMARGWLESSNNDNRNLRDGIVARYSADMTADVFDGLNGETLKFGIDGILKDGQHRLAAVIDSGCTVEFLVMRNVPDEAKQSLDQGTPRTITDYLVWEGYSNAKSLASVAKVVAVFMGTGQFGARHAKHRMTRHEVISFIKSHPELVDFLTGMPERKSNTALLGPTTSTALYYILAQTDGEDSVEQADTFFDLLGSGNGLSKGDPIHSLRRTLENNLQARHGAMGETHKAAITIKAWNAWRKGEEILHLRWSAGGAKPETFPRIYGYAYDNSDADGLTL